MQSIFLKFVLSRPTWQDGRELVGEKLIKPDGTRSQSFCENGAAGSNTNLRTPRWKRALDICLALSAIPCLLPLLVMIVIIIKSSSKGPLLFTQERVGLRGTRFTIYKFRTMHVGADTVVHEAYTSDLIASDKPMAKLDAHDNRLIPFGRQLRAAGLDELPQLINVLLGEMSIVGPRPCLPNEFVRYSVQQRERFNTPPGLTGLWQVSGKNRRTFSEMVDLDIQYVRNRSLWLDLRIILKTIPAVIVEVTDTQSSSARASMNAAKHADERSGLS